MKKRFLVIVALIGLLTTCREPASNLPDNIIDPNQEAVIVFDNTQGICAAAVFNDYRRRDEDKIAEIPAGASSQEIEWTPGTSVPFYFSYRINLKGISGFTLNYTPEVGKDQTAVRIDANKKTTIKIPKLDETVSSPDMLLSDNSFLLIQNNSSFSFQLYRGNSSISPDGSLNSALVNSGERAQYTINPGTVSNYRLLVGADYVSFPDSLVSFEAGRVYSFVFDGGVSLSSEIELNLKNIETPGAPDIPGRPVLIAGYEEIAVSWQTVELAEAYEVWFGTSVNSAQAEKFGGDITGGVTETTITGLANETTYYVWIKAKNAVRTSGFSLPASAKPYTIDRLPGLYRGNVKIGDYNLSSSLSYISSYAVSGDNYFIILGEDESVSPKNLNYSGKNVGITLIGYGGERKITRIPNETLISNESMFTISNNVTLTIDENISLIGSLSYASLINVSGTLIMNGGTISGNDILRDGRGGGINIDNDGTFIMNGGTISGNTLRSGNSYGGGVYVGRGTFTMNGGTISGNTTQGYSGITNYGIGGGGGIYVASDGTFIMHGGTISGNTASMDNNTNPSTNLTGSACGGGIYVANGGTITMSGGTISGNTASGYTDTVYGRSYGQGGGVFVIGGTFTMDSGSIIENTADSGGGILVTHGGIVTMNGGTISKNTSIGTSTGTFHSSGGGIYVYGGTVTMYGGTISGNTAYHGGGIYIYTSAYYSVYSIYKKLPPSGGGQNSGIIYGNEETGVDEEGSPLKNTASSDGHAVYFIYETAGSTSLNSDSSMRNTTAGQTDYIDTETGRGLSASGNAPFGE